jgi:hypothetical protein
MTNKNDIRVVEVTAAIAEEYLKSNASNRRVRWFNVSKYAADMVAGRWLLSTDLIGFDTSGRLIQGQHRLFAVIEAEKEKPGISVPMLVAWGFPPDTYDVLDQGSLRGVHQVLATHGVTNAIVTAAAARQVLFYDRFPSVIWRGNEAVSRVEVTDFVLQHREDFHEAQQLRGKEAPGRRSLFNVTSMTVAHFLVMRDSEKSEMWDSWMDAVATGANLPPGHPALVLRNGDMLATWGMNGAQPRLGAYIKMWNYFIEGRTTRALRFRRDELPMPKVN